MVRAMPQAHGRASSEDRVTPLTASAIQERAAAILNSLQTDSQSVPLGACYREKEGCHHVVWSIGEYVLHALPSRPNNIKSLLRDRAVTTLVRNTTKNPHIISVPTEPFEINGWTCMLQKRLPGISLEDYILKGASLDKTTEDLVQLCKALRSIDYQKASESTYYEHERPNIEKRVKKAVRQWEELRKVGYVEDDECRMRDVLSLARLKDLKPPDPYAPRMLHGDFSMQHILVNEDDGHVTGIIDWSDAMLGDPCEDIAGLALSIGVSRARRIAAEVGYDEHTAERGIIFARCLAVEDLRELECGTEQQPPEALLQAQFKMAFEGTGFGDIPDSIYPHSW
ncbi:hypothetical protein HII31_04950 [Pseudocercospora fuligena]|uniref:Aminoglycoside phosphotransferase domain-containing protein n=1 Tax=Pseudocercospora fuligena TaxID=685502 RepID=A0A8H6VP19_9PEZI|nr:hypothetical protein HII31_04950 [Pseudocercospora fuligena]